MDVCSFQLNNLCTYITDYICMALYSFSDRLKEIESQYLLIKQNTSIYLLANKKIHVDYLGYLPDLFCLLGRSVAIL